MKNTFRKKNLAVVCTVAASMWIMATIIFCFGFIPSFSIVEDNSSFFNKRVANAPSITRQPTANKEVEFGQEYYLSINAHSPNGGELGYQWYTNSNPKGIDGDSQAILGENEASMKVPTTQEGTYYYYVKVTNILEDEVGTIDSTIAIVIVNPIDFVPKIVVQPERQFTIFETQPFSLTVSAKVQVGQLQYQWYKLSNGDETQIANANTERYASTLEKAGTYRFFVEVSNPYNGGAFSVRSELSTIIVNRVIDNNPIIEKQPTSKTTVVLGNEASLSVSAIADPQSKGTISYQWFSVGSSIMLRIDGATQNKLDLPTTESGIAGYVVEVTNDVNGTEYTITSSMALVTVKAPDPSNMPIIQEHPISQYVVAGQEISLSIVGLPTEQDEYYYQWYQKSQLGDIEGVALQGQTGSVLNLQLDQVGTEYYYATITNIVGSLAPSMITSGDAQIVVFENETKLSFVANNISKILSWSTVIAGGAILIGVVALIYKRSV